MALAFRNASFDFDTHADSDAKGAFTRSPRRIELMSGTVICRIVSSIDVGPLPANAEVGSWWLSTNTVERLAGRAVGRRTSLAHVARLSLAVSFDFSSVMDRIVAFRLCTPYFGWTGIASPQPIIQGESGPRLPGGFPQIYVPKLHARDVVKLGSSWAVGGMRSGNA